MKRIYKVYNDGGAFIGIRIKTNGSSRGRRSVAEELIVVEEKGEEISALAHDENFENMSDGHIRGNETENTRVTTLSEEFKKFYKEAIDKRWRDRRKYVVDRMRPYFEDETDLQYFISHKIFS